MSRRVLAVVLRGAASTEEVTRAAPPLFARCGGATSRSADQLVPAGCYEEFWQLWCATRPAQRRSLGLLHNFLRAVVVQRLGVLTNWFLMDVHEEFWQLWCAARPAQRRSLALLHHFLRAVVVQRLGVLTNWFLMDVTKSSGGCGARRGQHRGGHSGCSTIFCALWCNVLEC